MKVYVLHENPEWYAPLAAAFDPAGLPHEQWLLGEAVLDLAPRRRRVCSGPG